MPMFGKKAQTLAAESAPAPQREVPVFTVHSLPRSYEALCTVFAGRVSSAQPSNVLQQLGIAGGAIPECDAVIGIILAPVTVSGLLFHAYGTAIHYTE
jgi:hypothetical protein